MSLDQLDELWKYEWRLCSILTGLPLRNCSAKPNLELGHLYPAMSLVNFRQLKQEILRMWVRGAHYFCFKDVPRRGWGIFVPAENDQGYPTTGHLHQFKPCVMGWLARAPTIQECPTGHRYLRSPVEPHLYLGGPISLANQDEHSRINVMFPTSNYMAGRHLVTVTKARAMPPGSELLWTYSPNSTRIEKCNMHTYNEWFFQCCTEELQSSLLFSREPRTEAQSSTSTAAQSMEPPQKKGRLVGGIRPLKQTCLIPRYCLCTLCGINVDAGKKYSPNLKRHLSLNHAVDIVRDMGRDPVNPDSLVDPKEFVLHVDTIGNVLDSLHQSYISFQPACLFLQHIGKEANLIPGLPVEEEKERVFQLFLRESSLAVQKYQVVYLRGAAVPTNYEHLLPCDNTSLDAVVWCAKKPSNTNFSINQLKLSDEEKNEHRARV